MTPTTKKILIQLDTAGIPSTFDTVVAYDSGVDHLITYPAMDSMQLERVIHGAIFTRPPQLKKHTAIFVSGENALQAEAMFDALQGYFFSNFRVSVMLDSRGGNTTAAAIATRITALGDITGKKAVILAGTGAVGQRAATLLAREGATVTITSRRQERAEDACIAMKRRFDVELTAQQAANPAEIAVALEGAHIAVATGPVGAALLPLDLWRDHPSLEILVDVSTVPPTNIDGIEMQDRGVERYGKLCFGGLGIGGLKLRTHRAAVSRLFESNDLVLDVEAIYNIARELS